MRKLAFLLVAVVFAFLFLTTADAQELRKAKKLTNVKWYSVTYNKFKAGKVGEARKIIHEHFVPVDNKIGRDVFPLEFVSGDWHHVVSFPMDEGPDQLAWEISPTGEKWWAAFVKQEGGKENAESLMQRFQDMIATSKQEIAYRKLIGEEVTQK